jgi:hypothetical protein
MRYKISAIFRLVVFGAIAAAVSTQFYVSVIDHDASALNFFSYFTILSNIFAALIFLVSAIHQLRGKKPSAALEAWRGAATVYMVTTGIIYALLLSQHPLGLTLAWVNLVLHQLAPVTAALDWLLAPPKVRMPVKIWWSWLAFPLIYVIYTLIRGPIANWYPYPFLDPSEGGYGRVLAYCAAITVFIVLLASVVGWTGNFLGAKIKRGSKNGKKK